jgi:hypothetical protein
MIVFNRARLLTSLDNPPRIDIDTENCRRLNADTGHLNLATARNPTDVGIYGNRHKPRVRHLHGPQHQIIHLSASVSTVPLRLLRDAAFSTFTEESS